MLHAHNGAIAYARPVTGISIDGKLGDWPVGLVTKIHSESPKEYWNDANHREGAGLGLHVRESNYGNVIGHGGNNGDFKCLFEVYQELNMGYVVFTNSDMGDALAYDLADLLVEGEATD